MAVAMSGATCLLLCFAIANRHLPKTLALPKAGEWPEARELDIQLEALAPRSDLPGETPAATTAAPVNVRRAQAPSNPRPIAIDQSASIPVLFETPAVDVSRAAGSASGHAHEHGDTARATSEPRTPSVEVLPFGDGMTRPRLLSGRQPAYTAQALAARVEGKVIVRCVITTTGDARDCRIVKPLPLLDRAVVTALLESRFAPATFRGQSVDVNYLFTFDFKLP